MGIVVKSVFPRLVATEFSDLEKVFNAQERLLVKSPTGTAGIRTHL